MKRIGYLYEKIISINNLKLADKKAQKGKSKQFGVIKHNKNKKSIASYNGWLLHANTINLRNKYLK